MSTYVRSSLYSTDSKTSQEIDATDIDTHIHDDLKKENNRLRMELATVSFIYSKIPLIKSSQD